MEPKIRTDSGRAFVNFKTRERWQKGAQIENCKATLEEISMWKLRKSFSSFHFDILYSSLTFVQLLQPDCVALRFLSYYALCIVNCYIRYATANSIMQVLGYWFEEIIEIMDKTEYDLRIFSPTVTVIVFICSAMTMEIIFPIKIQSNSLCSKLIIFNTW